MKIYKLIDNDTKVDEIEATEPTGQGNSYIYEYEGFVKYLHKDHLDRYPNFSSLENALIFQIDHYFRFKMAQEILIDKAKHSLKLLLNQECSNTNDSRILQMLDVL